MVFPSTVVVAMDDQQSVVGARSLRASACTACACRRRPATQQTGGRCGIVRHRRSALAPNMNDVHIDPKEMT
jgi:hypothetical protein